MRKQRNAKKTRIRKTPATTDKRREWFEEVYLREKLMDHADLAEMLNSRITSGSNLFGNEAQTSDFLNADEDTIDDDSNPDAELIDRQKNSSRRFKRFWKALTLAQKEALRMVYINNRQRLTKEEIAGRLGIRVDTHRKELITLSRN
jgi:DNA-directed RNA polymerase specialized sigma24 family protein